MIFLADKEAEALQERRLTEAEERDLPPTYSSLEHPPAESSGPRAVNYVSISRCNRSVKETLILDPTLLVPLPLRPPLSLNETEATRRNLRLECTHGHIHADITLAEVHAAGSSSGRDRRVAMKMKSTHGGVNAKIHRKSSQNTFVLEAHAVNGNIRLAIPRTFCGPIVVSHRQGFVGVSDSISRHLTTFGEADNTRRCFLGDFRQYSTAPEASKEGWSGDELILSVRYGNVKIQYDDDAAGSIVKTRPNTILNRFFGF